MKPVVASKLKSPSSLLARSARWDLRRRTPPARAWWIASVVALAAASVLQVISDGRSAAQVPPRTAQPLAAEADAAAREMQRWQAMSSDLMSQRQSGWPRLLHVLETVEVAGVALLSLDIDAANGSVQAELRFADTCRPCPLRRGIERAAVYIQFAVALGCRRCGDPRRWRAGGSDQGAQTTLTRRCLPERPAPSPYPDSAAPSFVPPSLCNGSTRLGLLSAGR
jgi:hypothetical protein